VVVVAALLATGAPPAAASAVRYQLPAAGPVVRSFDPGSTPFGPGHRGVDLDVPVGSTVAAAAGGIVRHAGPVAGITWVSIDHADGIRTSYGPLADLRVGRGQPVEAGAGLGRLAPGGHGHDLQDRGVHWGARRDGRYLDPLSLLTAPGTPSLVGAGGWRGTGHAVTPYEPWGGGHSGGLGVRGSPTADRPGFAVAPNPNHLVLVRGLGSSSDGLPFDPHDLGYDPRSVTAHSYAGPDPDAAGDPADPWRVQHPYGPADTWAGVEAASAHLRDQLRARWAAEPGRAVDLMGYSMGGVVVAHYLAVHHDPYDPTLPPVGHVVTIASPLRGSDLAGLSAAVRDHHGLAPVVHGLQAHDHRQRTPPLDATALADLRPGSAVLRAVEAGWRDAAEQDVAGALAMGTRVLTIAGASDRVVGADRAVLPVDAVARLDRPAGPAHEHRVLPGDHGSVLESEALREVTWRFLAGEEVVTSPGHLPVAIAREHGSVLQLTGGLLRVHGLATAPWHRPP
jgi:alpha-beta hydrolase superfamily lysophospholipase